MNGQCSVCQTDLEPKGEYLYCVQCDALVKKKDAA